MLKWRESNGIVQLSVYSQHQGLSGCSLHEEPAVIPYKILESTVKCFHSGGEALRWN
jgi:hypothetical protein